MQPRERAQGIVLRFVLLALWGCAFSASAAAQTDPAMGTWALNPSKSTFSPGPPPKSAVVIISPSGQGIHVTADLVDAQGVSAHSEYMANYDGKDYPIKGVPTADTVSVKRLDTHTAERTDKKAGKAVTTYHRKVSKDGKTMTVMQKGTDAQGRPFNNTLVFDKKR